MARSRPGEATVARLLALADVQLDGPRPWDLQVRDPAMFTRVLAQGSLGFGEAYIDGDWVAADLDDRDWNTSATLRLRPHQALTAAQSQMIRLEYFEGTVGLALTRRAPLVPYLIQAYRAALVPDRELPPAFLLQVHEPEQLPPLRLLVGDTRGRDGKGLKAVRGRPVSGRASTSKATRKTATESGPGFRASQR